MPAQGRSPWDVRLSADWETMTCLCRIYMVVAVWEFNTLLLYGLKSKAGLWIVGVIYVSSVKYSCLRRWIASSDILSHTYRAKIIYTVKCRSVIYTGLQLPKSSCTILLDHQLTQCLERIFLFIAPSISFKISGKILRPLNNILVEFKSNTQ